MMRHLGDILAGGRIPATNISSGTDPDTGADVGPDAAAAEPAAYATPSCARCDDAGFVRLKREPGDPDFGRAVPCACAQQEAEAERDERLRRYSNLGSLTRIRFDTLERDRSEPFARAFDAAQVFARGKDRDAHWLFLWGEHGKGKTALGVALANERISHGLPALYVVVPDLLDHLRAAYQADAGLPYPRLFEQVRNAPFLILDDLDATNLTPWADEKLFQLLNHRANTGLLTVVLSSRHPNALEGSMRSLVQRVSGSEVVGLDGGGEAAGRYREIGGMTEVHLRQFTFETFRLDGLRVSDEEAQNLDLVRNMAQKWAQEPEGWFTLIGETGTGKTHLAAAIAHEQVERGADVFFAVVPDLLDYLRRAYHPTNPETYDDVFDALRETRLLILDDLGAHSTTAWAREKLYQLFSYRYIQALPTVITTNHNLEDLDPRLASRMADHQQTRVWRITARDYRTGATPRSVRDAAPKRRPSSWDKPRW